VLKDLLQIADLTTRDITYLVELASDLERCPRRARRELAGELVVVYLTEPSPDAELTFTAAATRLGAGVVVLGPEEFQRGYGAKVTDIARAVSLYGSVVVTCTDDANLRHLAAASTIPVLNGLNKLPHNPCPTPTELTTPSDSAESLDGRRLTIVTGNESRAASPGRAPVPTIDRPRIVTPTYGTLRVVDHAPTRIHRAAAVLLALHRRQLFGPATS